VARNGAPRGEPKGGRGGRAGWGSGLEHTPGPNSKRTREIGGASPGLVNVFPGRIDESSNEAASPEPEAESAPDAAAAAPEAPKEDDPADKLIGFDDLMAIKAAKRADDGEFKLRELQIDDKQWKAGKTVESQKKVEYEFKDLQKVKKDKKEKSASKRAIAEAIDLAPSGVVQQPVRDSGSPRGESRGPRPDGPRPDSAGRGGSRGGAGFRGRGNGRGGRGGRGGGASRGSGFRLEADFFPSLVPPSNA